jgi:hypothetical protein
MKTETHWISAEINPKPQEDVLVLTDDFYIGIGWHYEDSGWCFEVDRDPKEDSSTVTHWCPLPKIP